MKAKGSSYGVAGLVRAPEWCVRAQVRQIREAFRDQSGYGGVIRNQGVGDTGRGDSGTGRKGVRRRGRGTEPWDGEEDH